MPGTVVEPDQLPGNLEEAVLLHLLLQLEAVAAQSSVAKVAVMAVALVGRV